MVTHCYNLSSGHSLQPPDTNDALPPLRQQCQRHTHRAHSPIFKKKRLEISFGKRARCVRCKGGKKEEKEPSFLERPFRSIDHTHTIPFSLSLCLILHVLFLSSCGRRETKQQCILTSFLLCFPHKTTICACHEMTICFRLCVSAIQ